MVVKSPNKDKSSLTTRAAEYTMVNTDVVLVKSINIYTNFLTYPTRAAEYTTMNTIDLIAKSPNSGENFLQQVQAKLLMQ